MAALAVLSACAEPTPYVAPTFGFLSHYKGGSSRDKPVLVTNTDWWKQLQDPVLDTLIDRALAQNLTIAIARARLDEAKALYEAVPAPANLTSSASARGQGTDQVETKGAAIADIGFNWLFDNNGARKAELRAAEGRVGIADAQIDAARLTLLYNLANAYLQLRYQQQLVALAESHLQLRRKMLSLTRTMEEASSATRIDTTRAEARVAEIEAQLPLSRSAAVVAQNQIAVLVGVQPGTLDVDLSPRRQPVARMSPQIGIPADLVRNRPDIRIAERSYYVDIAQIDRARAALYPSLSLSGAITLTALQGASGASEYYLGPAVQFPSLPTGSARASVRAAHARAEQDHLSWTDTVLQSILEVENALDDYRSTSQALTAARRATRYYDQAGSLTLEVFERGAATMSEVIDTDEDRTDADNTLAQITYRQALAFVTLNVRLGSGSSGSAPPAETVASAQP